jgi:hypothetical protein
MPLTPCALRHHVDHVAQIALHGRQAADQRAGFILAGRFTDRLAEVAMRNALGDVVGGLQRPHDAAGHPAPLRQQ